METISKKGANLSRIVIITLRRSLLDWFTLVELAHVARNEALNELEAVVCEVFARVGQKVAHYWYSCGEVGRDGCRVRTLITN